MDLALRRRLERGTAMSRYIVTTILALAAAVLSVTDLGLSGAPADAAVGTFSVESWALGVDR